MANPSDLFVRVFGINRRLGLIYPDVLVERLQEGALQQRQSSFHLPSTLAQSLLTLTDVLEAQRAKLLHLNREEKTAQRYEINSENISREQPQ